LALAKSKRKEESHETIVFRKKMSGRLESSKGYKPKRKNLHQESANRDLLKVEGGVVSKNEHVKIHETSQQCMVVERKKREHMWGTYYIGRKGRDGFTGVGSAKPTGHHINARAHEWVSNELN